MRTTQTWWDAVSNDSAKMIGWLKDQYHGEVTASGRIRALLNYPDLTATEIELVNMIADDEAKHAEWVKQLLDARGIEAKVLDKDERYWDEVLLGGKVVSFSQMCAIGHHAEVMRLERIRLLAEDVRFNDIAETFAKILTDEVFHAKAFKVMSSPEDIESARTNHAKGMNALGLVI